MERVGRFWLLRVCLRQTQNQRRGYRYKDTFFGYSNVQPVSTPALGSLNIQPDNQLNDSGFFEVDRTTTDLVEAYRRFGYRASDTDPLKLNDNSQ